MCTVDAPAHIYRPWEFIIYYLHCELDTVPSCDCGQLTCDQ